MKSILSVAVVSPVEVFAQEGCKMAPELVTARVALGEKDVGNQFVKK